MTTKTWGNLANQLTKALGLQHAPIAITFTNEAPAVSFFEGDMPAPSGDGRTGKVAAGCVFWIKAADETFTTVPSDHYNCSVGSVTHGLKKLDEVMANEDVQGILEAEWVTPEEAMHCRWSRTSTTTSFTAHWPIHRLTRMWYCCGSMRSREWSSTMPSATWKLWANPLYQRLVILTKQTGCWAR